MFYKNVLITQLFSSGQRPLKLYNVQKNSINVYRKLQNVTKNASYENQNVQSSFSHFGNHKYAENYNNQFKCRQGEISRIKWHASTLSSPLWRSSVVRQIKTSCSPDLLQVEILIQSVWDQKYLEFLNFCIHSTNSVLCLICPNTKFICISYAHYTHNLKVILCNILTVI